MHEFKVYAANSILIDTFETEAEAFACRAKYAGAVAWHCPPEWRWWQKDRRLP